MAMMVEDPNDPFQQCPLQKSHVIRRSRMAVHLAKCVAATNPGSQMVRCLYDSTHWVPQPLLGYHMAHECDKRELFEKFVHQPDATYNPNPSPFAHKTELPTPEENWDDVPATTYDPQLKASSEAVLRTISVVPKSKRKEFRQREVERFQELAQKGKAAVRVTPVPQQQLQPTPLRQPRVVVAKLMGAGRGTAVSRQEEKKKPSEKVGEVTGAPDVEIDQAMGRLQLGELPQDHTDGDMWVTVGRGLHKKKEFPKLRLPMQSVGAPSYIVPDRDAVEVSRGRGKISK